jgi:uncharacterized membrane protein (UPF0127 family)
MKIKTLIYIAIMAVAAVMVWRHPAERLSTREIVIETSQSSQRFQVEIATTAKRKARGLMHRESLPGDYGMLFVWPTEKPIEMWMKDTLLSLDMFFINAEGTIVYIAHSTTPNSTDIITAHMPVLAVLEVAGGTAKNKHIEVGDRVIYPIFKP